MKLPKMKLSVVLAAGLLLAACGSENSCAIPESALDAIAFLQVILDGPPNRTPNLMDFLPASMSDSAALKVWVAEAQSNGPLSMFTLSNGSASTAMPINILPGVHAGGITSWIGPTPQQSFLYLWANSTIYVLDDQDGSVITSIPLGTQGAIQDFTVAPNGKFGYATVVGNNKLYVVDLTTNTVSGQLFLKGGPFECVVARDSSAVYVTYRTTDTYSVIDPTTLENTTVLLSGQSGTFGKPAVTPDGTQLWTPNAAGSVVVDDVGSGTTANSFVAPAGTSEIAFSPDGTSAYLLVIGPSGSGAIRSVSTASFSTNWTAQTGLIPKGLFVTPQGSYLAVANSGDGTVSIFNASSGALVSTTDVGMTPVGVELNH